MQLRNITWFRGGLPGKARDFNWHNTIGFWSFAPLFVVVLSATVISYPWASNLAYRVVGEDPPATAPARAAQGRDAGGRDAGGRDVSRATPSALPSNLLQGLDAQLARARQQVNGWRTITLRVPTSDKAPAVFTIDEGTGGQPHKRGTLTLERTTGEVVKWEPFASGSSRPASADHPALRPHRGSPRHRGPDRCRHRVSRRRHAGLHRTCPLVAPILRVASPPRRRRRAPKLGCVARQPH